MRHSISWLSLYNCVYFPFRGCSFVTKTINAEEAGAVAVVIMDNDSTNDEKMVDMIGDDTGREVTLPAFFLLGRDG